MFQEPSRWRVWCVGPCERRKYQISWHDAEINFNHTMNYLILLNTTYFYFYLSIIFTSANKINSNGPSKNPFLSQDLFVAVRLQVCVCELRRATTFGAALCHPPPKGRHQKVYRLGFLLWFLGRFYYRCDFKKPNSRGHFWLFWWLNDCSLCSSISRCLWWQDRDGESTPQTLRCRT